MLLHHRGVFPCVCGNIVEFTMAKPPIVIMMIFVAALTLSLFSLSFYVTSTEMIDTSTNKLFDDMLRSFTGLTFCLVNSTKISNPVYEKDTVDIALSLKAILSGIFLSNFSEMESAVQAYWLFPLGQLNNKTINTCVVLSVSKEMLRGQIPLHACKPANGSKSENSAIIKMQPQFDGKKKQKRYQCASGLQLNYQLSKGEKYNIYLNLWEKSKVSMRLRMGSFIFLIILLLIFLFTIIKGRNGKVVQN